MWVEGGGWGGALRREDSSVSAGKKKQLYFNTRPGVSVSAVALIARLARRVDVATRVCRGGFGVREIRCLW